MGGNDQRRYSNKLREIAITSACLIFTALHGMQTRSSDEEFCLSVCPSHAWIVTKR